jgi:hypothetical protein
MTAVSTSTVRGRMIARYREPLSSLEPLIPARFAGHQAAFPPGAGHVPGGDGRLPDDGMTSGASLTHDSGGTVPGDVLPGGGQGATAPRAPGAVSTSGADDSAFSLADFLRGLAQPGGPLAHHVPARRQTPTAHSDDDVHLAPGQLPGSWVSSETQPTSMAPAAGGTWPLSRQARSPQMPRLKLALQQELLPPAVCPPSVAQPSLAERRLAGEPAITITIGHIEVRAAPPPRHSASGTTRQVPQRLKTPFRPQVTLAEFLARDSGTGPRGNGRR